MTDIKKMFLHNTEIKKIISKNTTLPKDITKMIFDANQYIDLNTKYVKGSPSDIQRETDIANKQLAMDNLSAMNYSSMPLAGMLNDIIEHSLDMKMYDYDDGYYIDRRYFYTKKWGEQTIIDPSSLIILYTDDMIECVIKDIDWKDSKLAA